MILYLIITIIVAILTHRAVTHATRREPERYAELIDILELDKDNRKSEIIIAASALLWPMGIVLIPLLLIIKITDNI